VRSNTIFFLLLFILFLSGCRQQEKQGSVMSDWQIKLVLDSIGRIDSLVMLNRMNNASLAVELARVSLTLARTTGDDQAMLRAYNNLGNAWSLAMMDSSFLYYTKALSYMNDQPADPEKPRILYNLAMLNVAASKPKNAIVLLDSTLQEAKKFSKYKIISNSLNALGNIYRNLGNDSLAKTMYNSAYDIAKSHHLPLQTGVSLGSLAQMEKDPAVELLMERRAIQYLKNCKDGAEPMASIFINSGSVMTNPDSAITCYLAAIKLINPEYASLTLLGIYNNIAYSFLEKGDRANAARYLLDLAFPLARRINDDGWLANLYDTYADVLKAGGDFRKALEFEKKSVELLFKADKKSADRQVRLLGAMLDLKNKEAAARAAQQEATQIRTSFAKARFWYAIVILGVLFTGAVLALFLLRNLVVARSKLVSAAKKIILVEEKEKTMLGRDLHDLTGHKLLNFRSFIESASFKNPAEQTAGLHILADLQEQLRIISHRFNQNRLEKISFGLNIEAMCREYIGYSGIDLAYMQPERYPELSEEIKAHLYRIIQELLTNAAKYAKTAHIALEISLEPNHLLLRYADDGPGFERENEAGTGIGLINIHERVLLMKGEVVLDTTPGCGVNWEISIPLNPGRSLLEKISGGRA
jgi:signal transduction histidine kinase